MNISEEEYYKCATNPLYFYKKGLISIVDGNRVLNIPSKKQVQILKSLHNHDVIGIIKGRCVGISYAYVLYVVWNMLFNNGQYKNIILMSPNANCGNLFISKVREVLLDNILFDSSLLNNNSRHRISYNGCVVRCVSHTDQLRGANADVFIIDEASSVKKLDVVLQIYTPIIMATGGKVVASSTMGGTSDEPFKKWYLERKRNSKLLKRVLMVEKCKNEIYNENAEILAFHFD